MIDIATRVNIWLCVFSIFLAAISIVTVIITLRQNTKMIEASTRPVISIYPQEINCGDPELYLVIRNFGQSTAYFTRFDYDTNLVGCYRVNSPKDYLREMERSVLAPGQSHICMLDYHKIPETVEFYVEYKSDVGNLYSSHFCVSVKAGTCMPHGKMCTKDKELKTISYTLQEMLQKSI